MSWISDAHNQWHQVNGRYNSMCPLDCGAISPEQAEAEDQMNWIAYTDEEAGPDGCRIRCAHCRGKHASVAVVRACAVLNGVEVPTPAEPVAPVAAEPAPDPWAPVAQGKEPPF